VNTSLRERKMDLDPLVLSAMIGIIGTAIGYILQNWFTKNREIDAKLYILKEKRYEDLIKNLSEGFHTVLTKGESTTSNFKKALDEAINVLWLCGSDDVLKALSAYLNSSNPTKEQFQNLVFLMRKDLSKKTTLKVSDIVWFRAS
jgi:hypothetical protein